jgi:hypothetical protein
LGLKGERGKVVILIEGFGEGRSDTVEERNCVGFEKVVIENCEENKGGFN